MNNLNLAAVPEKKDIQSSAQIQLLVDSFYKKVRKDPLLSTIFEEHIQDWEAHLPTMYQFWEGLLFGTGSYQGNPLKKHINLSVEKVHFETWVQIFVETVDEHFTGKNAQRAKQLANNIANTFQHRLGIASPDDPDAIPYYSRATAVTGAS